MDALPLLRLLKVFDMGFFCILLGQFCLAFFFGSAVSFLLRMFEADFLFFGVVDILTGDEFAVCVDV